MRNVGIVLVVLMELLQLSTLRAMEQRPEVQAAEPESIMLIRPVP